MKKTALRRLSKLLPAGRDIFDDEDEPLQPQPTPQLAVSNERPPGAAARSSPSPPHRSRRHIPSLAMQDALSIAYERGQIAKDTGASRRAIPGEYREEANKAESDAWLARYDAKDGAGANEVP